VNSLLAWIGKKIGLRDYRFWTAFYGSEAWAGEPVNLDTAMQVGAFAGCVKLYAQTMSTLPLGLYERQSGGRKERPEHPLSWIVSDEPNGDQDAAEYWENKFAWLFATGNAISEKIYDTTNTQTRRLVALDLLNPYFVTVHRLDNGSKVFLHRPPGRAEREIPEDRIFHLRGLSFGADVGISTVEMARQSISSARATERAAASHFANGMRPSGWLVYKGGTLEPDQRELARQNIINPMVGAENAGKIGILEGEFDYRQMTIEPEAAQLLESRRFSVEDVCRWFGVPPILLSHASQGQTMWGTGVEQILLGWYVLQVRPRLVRVEKAMKRQLLKPAEKKSLYFEHAVEGLLRGDSAARAEFYWKMLQVGALTPNQICDMENLPRWVGGDRHFVNTTLAPLDDDGVPMKTAQPAPTAANVGDQAQPGNDNQQPAAALIPPDFAAQLASAIGALPAKRSVEVTKVTKHDENGRIVEYQRHLEAAE
jgi:HK97 family phage portal protein